MTTRRAFVGSGVAAIVFDPGVAVLSGNVTS